MTSSSPAPAGLRCRPIAEGDIDAVIGLLRQGFADRSEAYWRRGLARHKDRALPPGYPVYGYLLEAGRRAVGVLLTLFTAVETDRGPAVRCNVSSWYVEPAFRSQGSLLETVATRRAEVTYLDVTPAPHTWPIMEARGFTRYCRGQMLACLALSRPRPGARARLAQSDDPLAELVPGDRQLLRDHVAYGCLGLVCTDAAGSRPLVFQRRTIGLVPNVKRFGQVPCLQLVFAHAADDVARFAGAAGRALLRVTGTPLVVIDAAGPVPGLVGRYFEGRAPKYVRGPAGVGLGDLAYTELVLFGP